MPDSSLLRCESVSCDKLPKEAVQSTASRSTSVPLLSDSNNADIDRDMRRQVGQLVVDTQQFVDAHLTLFRAGLFVTIAASLAVSIRLSGLLTRFHNVDEIPSWQFAQRKKLRVRMIRQSRQDPSVFYVYHTPFLRRLMLHDELPRTVSDETNEKDVLAVRPFGVQVDESSEEWVSSNCVASHRPLTIQLIRRYVHVGRSQSVEDVVC